MSDILYIYIYIYFFFFLSPLPFLWMVGEVRADFSLLFGVSLHSLRHWIVPRSK